ncbi:MAG TPA: IS21 family transposase [Phycisphaerae bacterium]|nr:IS21 family transposase [Phycisphaerae bacterium]
MTDRLRVQTLRNAGVPLGRIARQVGVSVRSVKRIVKEPPIEDVGSGATPTSRGVGRPSKVAALRPSIEQWLSSEPCLPTVEILSRLRPLGYDGAKSPVYDLVKSLRSDLPEPPLVRFEGLPGEFSQHDFGQVKVTYADGSTEIVRFFASRLKFSRFSHVSVVPDEKVESLVRALIEAFESLGGVPLQAVFDNPKTIVTSRANGRVEWNPTFAQVAIDYGFGIELCTPRQPRQKGSVENEVGWVKNSFFKVRRFHDHEDMLRQLAQWLHEVNTQRPSRATKEIPAARLDAERARLKPLAIPPQEYALRIPVTVRTTGFVEHGGIRYSMPPKTIGIPATLFLYPDRVRIVTRSEIAVEHPRRPGVGNACYRPEDRVAKLAAVHGQRAKLYLRRQEILELGPPAEALLTEWVHRPRFYWKQQVEELHALLVLCGPRRVLAAIEQALADDRYHVDAIAWLLDRKEAI